VPQKGLDPLQEGLPEAVRAVVADLRTVYTEGPFARLRAVEDAIVDMRTAGTAGPDLVTVSSATTSRLLSPRRGPDGQPDGRTALPRWPSVRSFLVVHGVDPGPYEERWAAARTAWAELSDAPPVEPVEPVEDPPPASGRGRRIALLVAAGVLLFAAGTGFGLFLGRSGGEPVRAEAVAPLSLPSPEEAAAGPTGVNCALGGTGGTVRFLQVAGADGQPGIPSSIRVDVEGIEPAAPGHTYWLMLRLFTEGLPYYAKAAVRPDTGLASYVLTFDSPIGSVRDIFVVEADPGAGQWLADSYAADQAQDATWAQKRGGLPPGAETASGTCRVERTR
jgi:hypothetical protein